MRYLCLGYYDRERFDAMSEEEKEALGERCRPHDEAVRIAALHPASQIGWQVGFSMEVRPVEKVWVEDGAYVGE